MDVSAHHHHHPVGNHNGEHFGAETGAEFLSSPRAGQSVESKGSDIWMG